MPYDPQKAIAYAHQWAFARNSRYLNFAGIGGDCTNFISQCLYAGGAAMNYQRVFGWYYNSANDRAPAWTGVEYLYNFLIANKGMGPYAQPIEMGEVRPGDIIQLRFFKGHFSHSLFVVDVLPPKPTRKTILVATHSDDSDNRPLSTYAAREMRFLKIGAR